MNKNELIAKIYHENSKTRRYDRRSALKIHLINESTTLQEQLLNCFKQYRGVPTVSLPSPQQWSTNSISLEEAILKRRSVRDFNDAPLSFPFGPLD